MKTLNGTEFPENEYDVINVFRCGGKTKTRLSRKGGKMQVDIKPQNKGKFTSYCGGKVTDACIAKAKASGNPTLVKRATFAANARKWKH